MQGTLSLKENIHASKKKHGRNNGHHVDFVPLPKWTGPILIETHALFSAHEKICAEISTIWSEC